MACLFEQPINNYAVQPATNGPTTSFSQQKTIQDLQVDNQTLRLEIENLKKEVDLYRDDVRNEVSNINDKTTQLHDDMDHWLTYLALLLVP